jgi:hypothetical protein
VGNELFYHGDRPLDADELLTALPSFTPDELASYQDDKYDQLEFGQAR